MYELSKYLCMIDVEKQCELFFLNLYSLHFIKHVANMYVFIFFQYLLWQIKCHMQNRFAGYHKLLLLYGTMALFGSPTL
jgi:hypothetical protein